MKRLFAPLLIAFVLSVTAFAADEAPLDAPWTPITVGDTEAFIMPDEVVRELGIPRRNIPEDENAATIYLRIFGLLAAAGYPPKAFYNVAVVEPWGAEQVEIMAWFRKTEEARRLVRDVVKRDQCEFPFMSAPPGNKFLYGLMLPHLAPMRKLARLMVAEGHHLEQEGKPKEALQSYLLLFPMADHSAQEPFLISGLVGIALRSIGIKAIRECLARYDLPAETLVWLAGELEKAEAYELDRNGWIAFECAAAKQMTQPQYVLALEVFAGEVRMPQSPAYRIFAETRAARILFPDRTMQKDFERFYDHVDTLNRMKPWETARAIAERDDTAFMMENVKDWNLLAPLLLPGLNGIQDRYIRTMCDFNALRIEVALWRYRKVHGDFPENLDAIAPEFIKALPPDPYTGKDFRYRREDDGCVVYSLGSNLVDDGGEKAEADNRQGPDRIYVIEPLKEKP